MYEIICVGKKEGFYFVVERKEAGMHISQVCHIFSAFPNNEPYLHEGDILFDLVYHL